MLAWRFVLTAVLALGAGIGCVERCWGQSDDPNSAQAAAARDAARADAAKEEAVLQLADAAGRVCQSATWSAMWYRPELDLHDINGADFQDGRYGVSGRLTGLPIYQNDGRQLLHLGVSGTWRDADKLDGTTTSTANLATGAVTTTSTQGGVTGPDVVRFRARPGLRALGWPGR